MERSRFSSVNQKFGVCEFSQVQCDVQPAQNNGEEEDDISLIKLDLV